MTKSTTFQTLTDVLAELEALDVDVGAVTPQRDELLADDRLEVTVNVRIPVVETLAVPEAADLTLVNAATADDGRIAADLRVEIPSANNLSGNTCADGSGKVVSGTDSPVTNGSGSLQAASLPPHHDPGKLGEVYESYDTFPEMTEALGVDVTPETVRQQMIKHDIHEPTPKSGRKDESPITGPDSEAAVVDQSANTDNAAIEEVDLETDLPDGVTLDGIIEAVQASNTVHEVARHIDVDRERTHAVLKELDLLDLVVGRITTNHSREVSREDVVVRLQEAMA